MRTDPALFARDNTATEKEPRFVVNIVYDVASLYITSHTGISGVPGTVIDGALMQPTVNGQSINPDEGSSEIGSASFSIADLASAFTDAVRDQLLSNLQGLRGRTVRFYVGYSTLAFSDFVLIGTQMVTSAIYRKGAYEVSCSDIQRTLKKDIFDVIQTTLAATISATDTTITLASVTGLAMVPHGTSYSDAPSSTVGYIKIKDEVIRYTVINTGSNQVTGCTRGALGTIAAAYTVDPLVASDRREKVSEYIYLELPSVYLAYTLLTGKNYAGTTVLPSHWHLGIDTSLIDLAGFAAIGTDLWDPTDDSKGFIVRFDGITKQDGKRFIEKELYLLSGVYSPVTSDGRLSLRRMNSITATSPGVVILSESNSTQIGDLVHDFDSLHNAFIVNWSYDGKTYRRRTAFIDSTSVNRHGRAPTLELNFRGLVGSRHTDGIIFQRLDSVRDRYAGPPLRMTVECLPSLNAIEIGDVVRVQYASVRDFTKTGTSIDRAFEVQSVSINQRTGRVTLDLFGSTATSSIQSPTSASTALPDAYYTSGGTSLATQIGAALSGNTIVSNCNLPDGIYRHNGDLTINSGVTVTINGTVQLRVKGFLTVNGTIDGVGRGKAGVADTGQAITLVVGGLTGTTTDFAAFQPRVNQILGTPGFIGSTIGSDGVDYRPPNGLVTPYVHTRPARMTFGTQSSAPVVAPAVVGGSLTGFFTDVAGTGGGPGGRGGSAGDTVAAGHRGGAGGNGGAGLIIICRGMAVGLSSLIDLSGANGSSPASTTYTVLGIAHSHYPGSGAAGMPGACYIFLDGSGLSLPDLSTKFVARSGTTTLQGSPLGVQRNNIIPRPGVNTVDNINRYPTEREPVGGWRGAPEQPYTTALDMTLSALRIQYIAATETASNDLESQPPPITALTTTSRVGGVNVSMTVPTSTIVNLIQVYGSQTNDRTTAVLEFEGAASQFLDRYTPSVTKYYWARTVNLSASSGKIFSSWYPVSSTAGVSGAPASAKFLTGGSCFASDVSASKIGGTSGFNSSVYSVDGYVTGHLQFKGGPSALAGTGNDGVVVGINTDPTTDSNYTGIDYSWNLADDGTANIYEGGSFVGAFGSWDTSTELSILWTDTFVAYLLDRSLVRVVSVSAAVRYMDSSFFLDGNSINSIRFGYGNIFEEFQVNTAEISNEAATAVAFASGISFSGAASSSYSLTIPSMSYDSTVTVTVTGKSVAGSGETTRIFVDITYDATTISSEYFDVTNSTQYVTRSLTGIVPAGSTSISARVFYQTISGSAGCGFSEGHLRAEVIKK